MCVVRVVAVPPRHWRCCFWCRRPVRARHAVGRRRWSSLRKTKKDKGQGSTASAPRRAAGPSQCHAADLARAGRVSPKAAVRSTAASTGRPAACCVSARPARRSAAPAAALLVRLAAAGPHRHLSRPAPHLGRHGLAHAGARRRARHFRNRRRDLLPGRLCPDAGQCLHRPDRRRLPVALAAGTRSRRAAARTQSYNIARNATARSARCGCRTSRRRRRRLPARRAAAGPATGPSAVAAHRLRGHDLIRIRNSRAQRSPPKRISRICPATAGKIRSPRSRSNPAPGIFSPAVSLTAR